MADSDQPHDRDYSESDIPASVIFTEMMRRAASAQSQNTPAYTAEDYAQQPAPLLRDPPPPERRDTAVEAQRIRRVQRRKARRRRRAVGVIGGMFRSYFVVLVSAALMATLMAWWISPDALKPELRSSMAAQPTQPIAALVPTLQPTPNWLRQIGVVSGHRGPENDPGAVCPDGLTENEINFAVAQRVVMTLRGMGYTVDLLEEFDARLANYQAAALISIHANDCRDYGELVTGFLVAQAEARPEGGEDTRLRECIAQHYAAASGLQRRLGLTRDMTDYHIFREIHPLTPGAILELGFMLADRELLTTQPDLLAQGIVNGILCFLEPAPVTGTTSLDPAATPAAAP